MSLTNTQTEVIGKMKHIISEQDKQLGYINVMFQVMEHEGERWCSVWSISTRPNDVMNQREYVLWVGPRGKVIQLKQPGVGPGLTTGPGQAARTREVRGSA